MVPVVTIVTALTLSSFGIGLCSELDHCQLQAIIDGHPDRIEVYGYVGQIYEGRGDHDNARRVYTNGFLRGAHESVRQSTPKSLISQRLCSLLFREKQSRRESQPFADQRWQYHLYAEAFDRWKIPSSIPNLAEILAGLFDNYPLDSLMVEACTKHTIQEPHSYNAFANLGKMHMIMDDITAAIFHFEAAKQLIPVGQIIRGDEIVRLLDDCYRFQTKRYQFNHQDSHKAIEQHRASVQNMPTSRNHFDFAQTLMISTPDDIELIEHHISTANAARVEEVNQQYGFKPRRWLADKWEDIGVVLDMSGYSLADTSRCSVVGNAFLPGSAFGVVPTEFPDQTIIAVELRGAMMESASGIITSPQNGVFFGPHITKASDYVGGINKPIIELDEVVAFSPGGYSNYYHFLIEGLSQLALSRELYPNTTIILPDTKHAREAATIFGIADVVLYNHTANSYRFRKLLMIDWRDTSRLLSSTKMYLRRIQPPAKALLLVRQRMLHHVGAVMHAKRPIRAIYVTRANSGMIRSVVNEDLLLEALYDAVGYSCLTVFQANQNTTLSEQAELFSQASLVIGPHGAGLSNILFSPNDSILVYFPTMPMSDPCFLNIAASVNVSVQPIADLTAYYFGPYHLSQEKIDSVSDKLELIISDRGWTRGDICNSNQPDYNHDL
uniref:Glycosyltransferase 61 catalytic domain-containing protein n=1 Tax=Spongospora subterranea TaxID=70186 RepID=A0A0H5QKG4_9EUKA|eukprot:CRZ02640.1 hypothetical protein [Spongospora subterranea]